MNYILDEIVMAGMVLETNADLILKAVKDRVRAVGCGVVRPVVRVVTWSIWGSGGTGAHEPFSPKHFGTDSFCSDLGRRS